MHVFFLFFVIPLFPFFEDVVSKRKNSHYSARDSISVTFSDGDVTQHNDVVSKTILRKIEEDGERENEGRNTQKRRYVYHTCWDKFEMTGK